MSETDHEVASLTAGVRAVQRQKMWIPLRRPKKSATASNNQSASRANLRRASPSPASSLRAAMPNKNLRSVTGRSPMRYGSALAVGLGEQQVPLDGKSGRLHTSSTVGDPPMEFAESVSSINSDHRGHGRGLISAAFNDRQHTVLCATSDLDCDYVSKWASSLAPPAQARRHRGYGSLVSKVEPLQPDQL